MSDYGCISALRVKLNDVDASPSAIIRSHAPLNYVRKAWIPQTMGDQIWVLYEFASAEQRLRWEENLSGPVKNWLDRALIPEALEYGWYIRDPNGFVEVPE